VNKLQVNIKSKFKIFYRPNGLAGDPAKAWQQLKFSQSGGHLTVANPTPYFVSFYSVAVGGQASTTLAWWLPSARKRGR
jgi:P pilus assembly chaperone PapD